MSIAYTGAHGWIGSRLGECLAAESLRGVPVRVRAGEAIVLPAAHTMIHLGAIAHDLDSRFQASDYVRSNAELSINLARHCAKAGYRCFVFVSSAKVLGDSASSAVAESAPCRPVGAYARSKHDAEQGLERLASQTDMRIVVLRPPLVYGPGVGANFRRLLRFADSPYPWPVAVPKARRSMIYIDNLIDAILNSPRLARAFPSGRSTVFHVADGAAIEIDALLGKLRLMLARPQRCITIPAPVVSAMRAIPACRGLSDRLFASLELDIGRIVSAGWQAPVDVSDALVRTVRDYRPEAA